MVFWFLRRTGQPDEWRISTSDMLGIPYRVYQLQRLRRQQQNQTSHPARSSRLFRSNSAPARNMRMLISQAENGPPFLIRHTTGWTFGSKMMATGAAVVLIAGVILTLLTMNSKVKLDAYRPIIFTILGILFIVIGPILVCRMLLNAYDRRLQRDHRQFEYFARNMREGRRREAETQVDDNLMEQETNDTSTNHTLPRRAQLAVDFILDATGIRRERSVTRTTTEAEEEWFPETLPSYERAMELAEDQNKHWMVKFFDYKKAPPPPYRETREMETFAYRELPELPSTAPAATNSVSVMVENSVSQPNFITRVPPRSSQIPAHQLMTSSVSQSISPASGRLPAHQSITSSISHFSPPPSYPLFSTSESMESSPTPSYTEFDAGVRVSNSSSTDSSDGNSTTILAGIGQPAHHLTNYQNARIHNRQHQMSNSIQNQHGLRDSQSAPNLCHPVEVAGTDTGLRQPSANVAQCSSGAAHREEIDSCDDSSSILSFSSADDGLNNPHEGPEHSV